VLYLVEHPVRALEPAADERPALADGVDGGARGLREKIEYRRRVAVDELGAELERNGETRLVPGVDAAADAVARFQDEARTPGACEIGCGLEPGGACAEDDDIVHLKVDRALRKCRATV
jgi:hypothetical protein